jgi:threonine synthase
MSFVLSLACRRCGTEHEKSAHLGCAACGAPLDPRYDWDGIAQAVTRQDVAIRARTIWRYRELLPLDHLPTTSVHVGWTPLVEVPHLADLLGVGRVWVKVEGVSFPSLSFKDRVVAVAINKALELGMRTVGCPSTGNLANAVAAHAAAAGLDAWVFIPDTLEQGKTAGTIVYRPSVVRVHATYDDINRLCRDAAVRYGWGMVNINLRAYYGEGSKTLAFEIAEQLGWRAPSAIVTPMAGGSLVTKLGKGFGELIRLGWIDGPAPRLFGAQPTGCAPIVTAVQNGSETITPVQPNTLVRSLAIGNPVDGPWATRAILESGGWAAAVPDPEMVEGITMLAEFGGIFAETAGGVTVAAARQLATEGWLKGDDEVVLCSTGNGLKTVEALDGVVTTGPVIGPNLSELEQLLSRRAPTA